MITALTSRRPRLVSMHVAQAAITLITLAALLYVIGAPLYSGG